MSTSARLVEQVLDRHQKQPDQFGAIAMQDSMPHASASWLPASFPGETPEQPRIVSLQKTWVPAFLLVL